jgi:predicted N-acyltransferase
MHEYNIEVIESLAGISPLEWDALTDNNPTLKYAWIQSMIDSGCTAAETGWLPQFIVLRRLVNGQHSLTGAIPLYMKGHSYGEYVFDWAWADAYHRAGLSYYPKLLAAVPFTPCTGARLLAKTEHDEDILLNALLDIAQQSDVSSLHVLFAHQRQQNKLLAAGLMPRQAVQFHWRNNGYRSFDDFLSRMSHDKRKRIKQERKRVRESGVELRRLNGSEITTTHWDFFTSCYDATYRAHHSTPYLNRQFFGLIGTLMPENVLMIIAEQAGEPIAASLNLVSETTLYGRYWGALSFVSGLHFETCYYQTIEYCIERGLALLEGGAQGEHKLARGFVPVQCGSAHLIKDSRFSSVVEDFLRRESNGIERYVDELNEHQPFKSVEMTAGDA